MFNMVNLVQNYGHIKNQSRSKDGGQDMNRRSIERESGYEQK